MPNTRTFVWAVPWDLTRAKRAKQLAAEADAEIIWDKIHDGSDTWLRMMQAAGEDAVICLEDDVYLTSDWRTKIEAVIDQHRDEFISFFSRGKPNDRLYGSRYMPGREFGMSQCVYLPKGMARDLAIWAPDAFAKDPELRKQCDSAMGLFMAERRMTYWRSIPSLVQHENWDSAMDVRRNNTNRRSLVFEP